MKKNNICFDGYKNIFIVLNGLMERIHQNVTGLETVKEIKEETENIYLISV